MSDTAIRVQNLGKRYRIGKAQERHDTLRDTLMASARASLRWLVRDGLAAGEAEWIWALRQVSFEIKRGEVVGIIGRNGAGKSTLLKVLSRITEPTEGYAEIYGRVGTLLEVGTGFHPELTGRENIYLSGAILGMRKREIDRKFDEIVAFAEIEKFIDTPVKHYSSGMYVRLAFAVAAHLEPEILLVDEVLAVGDAAFQKKCLGKMGDVAREGRTVLFVSHNMGAVNQLCTRAIHLTDGQVRQMGTAAEIVTNYLSALFTDGASSLERLRLSGYGIEIKFRDIQLLSGDGGNVLYGQPLEYGLTMWSSRDFRNLTIGSSIFNGAGTCVGSLITDQEFSIEANQEIYLRLIISGLNLAPGNYYAGVSIGRGGKNSQRYDLDAVIGKPAFQVLPHSDGEAIISHWNSAWGNVVFRDVRLVRELKETTPQTQDNQIGSV
jgi:homopolymeric O-antigen transport system ATP-binding protein